MDDVVPVTDNRFHAGRAWASSRTQPWRASIHSGPVIPEIVEQPIRLR